MPGAVKAVEKDALLTVRLRQQFGTFQLDIDFQVPLGLIVLFGFSGAGKSLTLRSMAGLLHPRQGYVAIGEHILFDSEAGIDLPSQERHVGYVPQHYALFPHLTVAQNISFALPEQAPRTGWFKRRPGREGREAQRVDELLGALELKGLERQYPTTLSGGQQQRVALARALAARPRLLLLDEPFNALDIAVRQRLRDSLKRFQRHFGIPIVLVTHDHDEAQQLADTVVALRHGQVAQVGSVQDIFFAPRTPEVARLVGQQNIFGGQIATPAREQCSPSRALQIELLQTEMLTRLPVPRELGWLPLPLSSPQSSQSSQSSRMLISGCIRNDEVLVHRLAGNVMPSLWTERGAAQWEVELVEAQMHGASVRLLVRPCSLERLAKGQDGLQSVLEIYISRLRWREIEAMPGETLLLEIGPEAIHCFEVSS